MRHVCPPPRNRSPTVCAGIMTKSAVNMTEFVIFTADFVIDPA